MLNHKHERIRFNCAYPNHVEVKPRVHEFLLNVWPDLRVVILMIAKVG
ncbi:hypothetical protein DW66_3532 [Pseudomonas putida]|nr:hypothetical protein DW66_3532 [Pseudomonas putida]